MTTHFKIAPLASDAFPEPPPHYSLFFVSSRHLTTHTHLHICIHTHATRIRKSYAVLNETPDTYFIV